MKCPKCNGLMYIEKFFDFSLSFYSWKCINCGIVIDRTILNNRTLKGEVSLTAASLALKGVDN